ncbi:VPDSG-CTERM sorting domain-containing protein [Pelagicoccus sp. SDUM812003]|uniref:VPDSG-CTERM sorting domain-containing protein n=1 Tax=Pelagicoccus sp. SDUM812003 TaxID=3041267 RepID=UPI00280E3F87|nr:VPDSG-CTERM sorting domain-containing protein [Pelagicoccus sp. SDUM812003]MDQ8201716.1 VPDSG-CTERM sorting domain-containing protein [Pelagicoccus sp. SDUM812003]
MNTLKPLATLAFFLSAMVSASGLTFTDVDLDGRDGEPDYLYVEKRGQKQSTWSSTFDLLAAGYDPLKMELVRATVFFAFADDWFHDGAEKATIEVGGKTLWRKQEVDGLWLFPIVGYDWYSATLDGELLADLQDGSIGYSVVATNGDFFFKEAKLVAHGEVSVPDTGLTGAMLGLGLAILFVLKKQMRSAKGD